MRIDFEIVKRHLDGKGTEPDRSKVIRLFDDLMVEKELREKSMQYWDDIPGDISDEKYDESIILGRIYREIKMKEANERSKPNGLFKITNFLAKVAAVLFIPLLVLYVSKVNTRKVSGSEITFTEIYSPLGSRTMFYLPDGSKGWLNGGSTLRYEEGFPGKTRNVSLRGEAFFNIKTDAKKPFVVSGKDLNIVAKGTSFNVIAWDDIPETEIILVNGKVDINARKKEGQKLISSLSPGEIMHYLPDAAGSYIQKVDVDKYVSWTNGRLVFREDPFTDVVKKINRWYNVNLVIKDKILESYKYVATFQDETLDEVLKMLALSAPLNYRSLPRKQLIDGTFEKRTIELYYNPHMIRKTNPMYN